MTDLPQSDPESTRDPATHETYIPAEAAIPYGWRLMTPAEIEAFRAAPGPYEIIIRDHRIVGRFPRASNFRFGNCVGREVPIAGPVDLNDHFDVNDGQFVAKRRLPSVPAVPDTTCATSPSTPFGDRSWVGDRFTHDDPDMPGRIITTHLGFDAATGRITIDGEKGAIVAPPIAEIQAMRDSNDQDYGDAGGLEYPKGGEPNYYGGDLLGRIDVDAVGERILLDSKPFVPPIGTGDWSRMSLPGQLRTITRELDRRAVIDRAAVKDEFDRRRTRVFVIIASLALIALVVALVLVNR